MSTSYTPNLGLGCPGTDDPAPWDAPIRTSFALIDALTTTSSGMVRARENPSSSLYITIAPASFRSTTGQVVSYAGATLTVTASTSTKIWLTDAGAIASGTSWPTATAYIPLAIVTAGATSITAVADERIVLASLGVANRSSLFTASASATIPATAGLVEGNATGGAFTLTLPSAVANPGLTIRIAKVDSTGNSITVSAASGQTINGASTVTLASAWSGKTVVSDGSNWVAF